MYLDNNDSFYYWIPESRRKKKTVKRMLDGFFRRSIKLNLVE